VLVLRLQCDYSEISASLRVSRSAEAGDGAGQRSVSKQREVVSFIGAAHPNISRLTRSKDLFGAVRARFSFAADAEIELKSTRA